MRMRLGVWTRIMSLLKVRVIKEGKMSMMSWCRSQGLVLRGRRICTFWKMPSIRVESNHKTKKTSKKSNRTIHKTMIKSNPKPLTNNTNKITPSHNTPTLLTNKPNNNNPTPNKTKSTRPCPYSNPSANQPPNSSTSNCSKSTFKTSHTWNKSRSPSWSQQSRSCRSLCIWENSWKFMIGW